jgi:hypothetical protein
VRMISSPRLTRANTLDVSWLSIRMDTSLTQSTYYIFVLLTTMVLTRPRTFRTDDSAESSSSGSHDYVSRTQAKINQFRIRFEGGHLPAVQPKLHVVGFERHGFRGRQAVPGSGF